jgi:acetyl-CoA carboxylase biotin carboxyl carrier protein
MKGLDLDAVRHALEIARRDGFAEVELTSGEDRFHAVLAPRNVQPKAPAAKASPDPEPEIKDVTSTLVGYFRPPLHPIQVGDRVAKGDVVGVVLALGLPNNIESPYDGEVTEWAVEADQPVQFGQPILRLKVEKT